ncbi:MAG: hypothetical protein JO032_06465 [Alphaproteobacteria bacterium]|nr:hypothetical protein [Alphaproteobacteria bacterium]
MAIRWGGLTSCLTLTSMLLTWAIPLTWAYEGNAEDAAQLCRETATDDIVRPIPPMLVLSAKQVFSLRMPDQQVQRSTVFRCVSGRVVMCSLGANLPCGKANFARHLPGAEAWCRDHADADIVPKFATGSASVYSWRCAGRTAKVVEQVDEVDERGFIARYWKPLK